MPVCPGGGGQGRTLLGGTLSGPRTLPGPKTQEWWKLKVTVLSLGVSEGGAGLQDLSKPQMEGNFQRK